MLEINCDLGEGIVQEELILPFIDTASVACGGHYGDEQSIRQTLEHCKLSGIKVGAHPSYPDRENFGRISLSIKPRDLIQSIENQINLFLSISQDLAISMDHIKFHGALYTDAAKNPDLAASLCGFLAERFSGFPLLVPPYSQIEKKAIEKGIPIKRELFGDRAYTDDYLLLSRTQRNALFTELAQVEAHLKPMVEKGVILSNTGKELPIFADTLCFHGDNPGILAFLPKIRAKWWN
ncbi:LamB/YcsF family protein [Algoriphagus sp.]|uniref:LamB/YcsF family protein n=1 Tax=Algoriphagus sp. TaxID=1872435 RepID=UPI002614CA67|nr:LamB/YcsF family protein [Algoriphagus sp.]